MHVRSRVTVADTSHLCQLNALMLPVCMQRATLIVITWSLLRGQEVPFTTEPVAQSSLTQVRRRFNGCWVYVLFNFPQYFLKRSLKHSFHFYFLCPEICNDMHQIQFCLICFEKRSHSVGNTQEHIPFNTFVHLQQWQWQLKYTYLLMLLFHAFFFISTSKSIEVGEAETKPQILLYCVRMGVRKGKITCNTFFHEGLSFV